ncbi:MAG TPA: UDP-2,3-diacylglucosamine diphosphatase, partial [Gammaproteobacteria bacterium]|nr:UDP-2,3-diacylglucosamine diphosphatase [Gammaproteobacteria bacterium]
MAYCFISDLHLQEEKPEVTEAFLAFLDTTAKQAERLYILGDLFEVWIGDDLKSELSRLIKEKLMFLKNSSISVFAMHGNRDFLIGEKFCEDTGVTLLEDPCKLELFGKDTLLMHGDLLCTKDVAYQEFRNTSRNPQWKKEFLDKPIEERRKITQELRTKSKKATSQKEDEIMDVSPEA